MAITGSNLTAGRDATDGTSYCTASVAPTGNKLVLVGVVSRRKCVEPPPIPTLCGGGMTSWSQVATQVYDTNKRRVTVFRALQSCPGSGVLNISFSSTQDRTGWIINEFSCVCTGGCNGACAIVQSATNSSTGSSVTVSLASFGCATNNAAFGYFGDWDGACGGILTTDCCHTRLGFTPVCDCPTAVGIRQTSNYFVGQDTSITSSGCANNIAGIGIEIKFSGGACPTTRRYSLPLTGIG